MSSTNERVYVSGGSAMRVTTTDHRAASSSSSRMGLAAFYPGGSPAGRGPLTPDEMRDAATTTAQQDRIAQSVARLLEQKMSERQ